MIPGQARAVASKFHTQSKSAWGEPGNCIHPMYGITVVKSPCLK